MRYLITAVCFMFLSSNALGSPVTVSLENPSDWADEGGTTTHIVILANGGQHPVLLDALNDHEFFAPSFEGLCRMKSPGPRWSAWQNVLLPGATTKIRLYGGRLVPGKHTFGVVLKYRVPQTASKVPWYKHVVAEPKPGTNQVKCCDRLGPVPKDMTVAYPGDLPTDLKEMTAKQSWALTVKANPAVVGLPKQDQFQDILPNVPHFGLVIWLDGMAHSVKEKELQAIGTVGREAIGRVGSALAAKKTLKINAASPVILEGAGFKVKAEERLHYATARVTRWDHIKTWYSAQVMPEEFDRLKGVLVKDGVSLASDYHYGLILETLTPGQRRLVPPVTK